MNFSPETKRNLVIGAVIAVFALGLTVAYDAWKSNRSVQPHFVPKREEGTVDVEITNPASRTYRGVRATFFVREVYPPTPLAGAPIAVDQIVFTAADYDSNDKTYSKSISQLKIPANDEATIRVYILDPRRKDWLYIGPLTIEYGDRDNAKQFVNPNHAVIVVEEIPDSN